MAVEKDNILAYIGIELDDKATEDTFKESFDKTFIRRDRAVEDETIKATISGESTRYFAKELKRAAKESGIELSEDETKLPVGDLARLLTAKKDEHYTGKIAELEKKNGKPSEAIKEWEDKYNQLNTKFSDVDKMRAELAEKYTAKEAEFTQFTQNFKKDQAVTEIWSKANEFLSDTATQLERKGFITSINENYKIELDGDKPVILKDGHRIPDPKKAGEFLDPLTAIRMEAEKNKILKVADPKRAEQKPYTPPQQPSSNPDGVRQSRIVRHKA